MTFYFKFMLLPSMFLADALLRMITRIPALLFEILEARARKDLSASCKSVVVTQDLSDF